MEDSAARNPHGATAEIVASPSVAPAAATAPPDPLPAVMDRPRRTTAGKFAAGAAAAAAAAATTVSPAASPRRNPSNKAKKAQVEAVEDSDQSPRRSNRARPSAEVEPVTSTPRRKPSPKRSVKDTARPRSQSRKDSADGKRFARTQPKLQRVCGHLKCAISGEMRSSAEMKRHEKEPHPECGELCGKCFPEKKDEPGAIKGSPRKPAPPRRPAQPPRTTRGEGEAAASSAGAGHSHSNQMSAEAKERRTLEIKAAADPGFFSFYQHHDPDHNPDDRDDALPLVQWGTAEEIGYTIQGRRGERIRTQKDMQDRHLVKTGLDARGKPYHVFVIADGHSGHKAAEYVVQNALNRMIALLKNSFIGKTSPKTPRKVVGQPKTPTHLPVGTPTPPPTEPMQLEPLAPSNSFVGVQPTIELGEIPADADEESVVADSHPPSKAASPLRSAEQQAMVDITTPQHSQTRRRVSTEDPLHPETGSPGAFVQMYEQTGAGARMAMPPGLDDDDDEEETPTPPEDEYDFKGSPARLPQSGPARTVKSQPPLFSSGAGRHIAQITPIGLTPSMLINSPTSNGTFSHGGRVELLASPTRIPLVLPPKGGVLVKPFVSPPKAEHAGDKRKASHDSAGPLSSADATAEPAPKRPRQPVRPMGYTTAAVPVLSSSVPRLVATSAPAQPPQSLHPVYQGDTDAAETAARAGQSEATKRKREERMSKQLETRVNYDKGEPVKGAVAPPGVPARPATRQRDFMVSPAAREADAKPVSNRKRKLAMISHEIDPPSSDAQDGDHTAPSKAKRGRKAKTAGHTIIEVMNNVSSKKPAQAPVQAAATAEEPIVVDDDEDEPSPPDVAHVVITEEAEAEPAAVVKPRGKPGRKPKKARPPKTKAAAAAPSDPVMGATLEGGQAAPAPSEVEPEPVPMELTPPSRAMPPAVDEASAATAPATAAQPVVTNGLEAVRSAHGATYFTAAKRERRKATYVQSEERLECEGDGFDFEDETAGPAAQQAFAARIRQEIVAIDDAYLATLREEFRAYREAASQNPDAPPQPLPGEKRDMNDPINVIDQGSTLLVCVVWNGWVIMANVGDSRGVLYKENPERPGTMMVVAQTIDHSPGDIPRSIQATLSGAHFFDNTSNKEHVSKTIVQHMTKSGKLVPEIGRVVTWPQQQLKAEPTFSTFVKDYIDPTPTINNKLGVPHRKLNLGGTMGDLLFKLTADECINPMTPAEKELRDCRAHYPTIITAIPDVTFVKATDAGKNLMLLASDGLFSFIPWQGISQKPSHQNSFLLKYHLSLDECPGEMAALLCVRELYADPATTYVDDCTCIVVKF